MTSLRHFRDGLFVVAAYFAVCALVSDAHAAHLKDTPMNINTAVIWHAHDVEPVGVVEAIITIHPPAASVPVVLPELYHWDPAGGYWISSASHLKIRHKAFRWRDVAPLLPSATAPAWRREEEVTADLLRQVGIVAPADAVAQWTEADLREAEDWASALYLWASDKDIVVPPMPEFLSQFAAERSTS